MPKQLNVNLAFTADTGQAKQQIQSLQQDLKNLVSATNGSQQLPLTKSLVEAKEAAGQLGLALKNATTSTGSLDLSKFDQSIKASGMKLSEYREKLSSMGPAGQQAFAKLAQSIVQAEVPLKRTNALLDNFKTTLINTARWQLSSSMLHGFMGALQSAYGYAQDLNGSLNNIRIVTGASVDEMTAFADSANKAAQALSTSTTQYTDAALIYYQQGIRDQEEIAARTETTIKLANVSRQSAEEVSQQMTAIWNNFADGSHNLEYYADAITALGASTAASSEEIATGLEKFAAIANTVGLSYEYATAAMATITAQTRQSADTVGTGLRTLFSRLEGLKLGDTLEDGVDLNKYSEALEAVGVHTLEANGDLRDMDEILYDLGERWDDLSKAQQVALAQTVGGVRQYTNLIALMDNWDKMQENVAIANGSEGTLQKQADIYAESWEAAQKRVKAAAQALYSDLLDDDFFIALANTLADLLQALDGFIDGIGGLRTVLPGVATLLMNAFGPQLANSIDNAIFNMMRGTEQMKAFYDQRKQEAMQEASMLYTNPNSMGDQAAQAGLERQLELTYQLEDAASVLSDEEIQRLQTSIDTVVSLNEQAEAMGRVADASKKALDDQKTAIIGKAALETKGSMADKAHTAGLASQQLNTIDKTIEPIMKAKIQLESLSKDLGKGSIDLKTYHSEIDSIARSLKDAPNAAKEFQGLLQNLPRNTQDASKAGLELAKSNHLEEQSYLDVSAALEKEGQILPQVNEKINEYIQNSQNVAKANATAAQGADAAADHAKEIAEKIRETAENAGQQLGTTGQVFVSVFQGISQVTMGISALANAFETLQSPDASGWEKFRAVLLGVSMGLPMIISGASTLIGTFTKLQAAVTAEMAAITANTGATEANSLVKGIAAIATGKLTLAEVAHNVVQAISNTLTTIGTALLGAYEAAVILVSGALATGITMQTAFNMAMTANPVGVVIAAIAALIVVIMTLTAGIKGLINLWNSHNIAAENAETAAANLQQQFQETKQAYDDLKASIEDYQGSLNAIEKLQKGTQEWKDAIRESNTEALELINSLGLIKDADYTIDKDGVIKINEDVLNEALDKKAQAADTAQMSALMGQASAKQTRAQAEGENIARNSGEYAVVNTAIDRLVNGDLKDQFSKNALSDEDLKQTLDIDDGALISAIKENAQAQLQAADMYTMASEESAKVALENNKNVQQSGYTEEISKAAGSIYEQAYNDSYNKYLAQAQGKNSADVRDNALEKYFEESGIGDQKGFKNEGNGKYSYLDEQGQRQKAEVTAEEVAMTLAAADAEQQLADTSTGLIDAFKNLDEAGTVSSEALKKFLTDGDLNSLKASELNEMKSLTNNGADTSKYLGSQFGGEDATLSNEEAQALGYESAQAMVEAFNQGLQNAQSNIADAGKDLIPSFMQDAFDQVSKNSDLGVNGKTAIATAIDSALEQGGNDAAKKLMDQFIAASNAGELTDEKIEEIIASAQELQAVDLGTLTNQIAEINKIIDGLETGDSISADDYAKLSEEQQSYFAMAMDGTYQLIGSAEELKEITSQTNFDKFKQMGDQAAASANAYGNAANIASEQGVGALSESAYMGSVQGTQGQEFTFDATLLETQLGLIHECQDELDISNAKLAEWQERFANGTVDPAMLRDVASAIGELNLSEEGLAESASEASEQQQEFQTAIALSAKDTNELQAMLEDGAIGPEAFNKGLEKLHNTLDEDIDTDQYEELADYFEDFGDEIEGVSKDMKGNKKAARELAKEISRFDAAIESVNDNYDDWMTDLKKGDKNSSTHAKTIKGLRNAYGDLLDVSGDTLSKNFLENAENLDLMARAAEGDVDAYNQLQDAVREDIAVQAGFDDAEFQAGFQDLMDKYYEGQNLDDLEVGASLNNEGFLQGLTDMVNAAGMTAQQATDYLASMGVDATVEEDTSTDTETNEVSGYRMVGSLAHAPVGSIEIPTGSGENMSTRTVNLSASIPQFTAEPDTQTVTTQKENKSFALKVTSANKSSGGGFKYGNSSNGGGGGGGCFIAGTLISTPQGFKSIEQIIPGDIVLSYNEQTGQNEYSQVLDTMIHYLWTDLYTINIGIEQIKVTGIHRFYVKRAGLAQWLPASELRADDLLYYASGQWQPIINILKRRQFKKVYNFEVANNHNYYVSKSQILAHNKGCFVAGTPIVTFGAFKNIEDIQIGDIVLSYNTNLQKNEYSEVVDTMIHIVHEPIYTLYIKNTILRATGIHRFYVQRDKKLIWIPARELIEEDLVLFADGTWNQIYKIEKTFELQTVYNFEVSGNHNYYVGQDQILAHNKGGRRGGGGRRAERIEKSRAERQEQKRRDEGLERYHVISNVLNKLHKQLDNISGAYDRAFGQSKIALLNKQISKQKELIKAQKEYVQEIKDNLKLDKERLSTGDKQFWSKTDNKMKTVATGANQWGQDDAAKMKADNDAIQKRNNAKLAKWKKGPKVKKTVKYKDKKGKTKTKTVKVPKTKKPKLEKKKTADDYRYIDKDIQTDANGTITNYDDLIKANNDAYNAAMEKIDDYNAAQIKKINNLKKKAEKLTDDDARKKIEKQYKALEEKMEEEIERRKEIAEAKYDGFLDYLKQYEETQDLLMEQQQELIDKQNELYDQKVEKTKIKLQLKLDISEGSFNLLSHLLEQVSDNAYKASSRIAMLSKEVALSKNNMNAYKQSISDIFSNHGLNGKDVMAQIQNGSADAASLLMSMSTDGDGNHITEDEVNMIRESLDGLVQENERLMELRTQVAEEIGTVMEENVNRLDRITEKMDHLKNVTNSYKNIVDLTGRQYLGITTKMYDAIEATNTKLAIQSTDMARQRMEQANKQYEMMKTAYAQVQGQLSDAERKIREEQLKEAEDYAKQMTQDYYSSWEEAIEAVQTRWESATKNMVEDFNAKVAGNASSLEALKQNMSLDKEIANVHLPEYEKMYQLSKLASDAQKAIDGSSNIKVQKELQQVYDKILEARKSGKEMSEYEVQFLQKELELKQAQLALEEAEEIKNQVRMAQDNEGNYSYVYTADESAVQNAEQDYNAKLYEMQKLNEEYITGLQEQLVSIQEEYASAMQAAAEMYGVGTEEYEAAVESISEQYQTYFDELTEQLNIAMENQVTTQEEFAAIYVELTGDVEQANVDLTDNWSETMLAQETGFESLTEYAQNFADANQELLDGIEQASDDWQQGMDLVYEAAGTSVEDFKDQTSETLTEIADESQEVSDEMSQTLDEVENAIEGVVTSVNDWEEQHSAAIESMIEANNELIASMQDIIAQWSELTAEVNGESLSSLTRAVSDASARLNAAKRATRRAKNRARRARTRLNRARTRLNRSSRRVSRRIRRAERRVRNLKSRLNRTRKGTRRYKDLRKRYDSARRTLNNTVKRASRKQRRAYNTYKRDRSAYNKARTNYTMATRVVKETTKAQKIAQKEYDNTQSTYDTFTNKAIAKAKNQTQIVDPTDVNSMLDSSVQQITTALSGMTISPQVSVTMPNEFKQNVTFEKLDFPSVTNKDDIINALTQLITADAASQYSNR